MKISQQEMTINGNLKLGGNQPVLFSGPCAVESPEICLEIGTKIKPCQKSMALAMYLKPPSTRLTEPLQNHLEALGLKNLYKYWKWLAKPLTFLWSQTYMKVIKWKR